MLEILGGDGPLGPTLDTPMKRDSCNRNFCFRLLRHSVRCAETLNSGMRKWPATKKMWKKCWSHLRY